MNDASSQSSVRTVVGCMTGTSLDALDLALVQVGGAGLGLRASLVRATSARLGALGDRLRWVAEGGVSSARAMAELALAFGVFHVEHLERSLGGAQVDLVCAHGQTVYHKPPVSWQLLNAAPIAEFVRVPVVFDLRAADLAFGGQGAPITPIADLVMFGDHEESRVIVNLGGFCNITVLPAGERAAALDLVDGFDLCACNHVLDRVAREVLGALFDEDGKIALSGRANGDAADDLRRRLESQRGAGRSLGTGDEVGSWIVEHRSCVSAADLAASACAALGGVIGRAISGIGLKSPRVVLAGGGVFNAALVAAIESACGGSVVLSDTLGVPVAYREAMAMAVLGALCQDRVPITLPRVTGCRRPAPVAGVWVLP